MARGNLRISLPALGAGFAPIHYASERDLFTRQGIDVEIVALEGGPACARSLLSGEVDLTYALGPLLREAMRHGSRDFRVISGLSKKTGFSVVAKDAFRSIEQLKGKTIESPNPDWSGGVYLRYVLSELGLEGKIQLAYSYVTQEERVEGLLKGEFDAGLLTTEKALTAEEHGFRTLLSIDDAVPGIASTAVLTTPALLREKREELGAGIRAIHSAIKEIQTDREPGIEYLAKRFSLSRNVASRYHAVQAFNWSLDLDLASVQKEIDICRMIHPLPPMRAEEIVDLSLLRETL
jgi:NitT/TauT family transport system substrate-binding protein